MLRKIDYGVFGVMFLINLVVMLFLIMKGKTLNTRLKNSEEKKPKAHKLESVYQYLDSRLEILAKKVGFILLFLLNFLIFIIAALNNDWIFGAKVGVRQYVMTSDL